MMSFVMPERTPTIEALNQRWAEQCRTHGIEPAIGQAIPAQPYHHALHPVSLAFCPTEVRRG